MLVIEERYLSMLAFLEKEINLVYTRGVVHCNYTTYSTAGHSAFCEDPKEMLRSITTVQELCHIFVYNILVIVLVVFLFIMYW